MPAKSDFPGLQRSPRKDGSIALHWVASRIAIAVDYTPKTVRLHYPDLSPELAQRCQDLDAQMRVWLCDQENMDERIKFDGTIGSYVKIYENHPESPYHEKDQETQRGYHFKLKRLYDRVGERRVDRLNGI